MAKSRNRTNSRQKADYSAATDELPARVARVLDPPQQYLHALAEARVAPRSKFPEKPDADADAHAAANVERQRLERAYHSRLFERLDMRRLVAYVPNKRLRSRLELVQALGSV